MKSLTIIALFVSASAFASGWDGENPENVQYDSWCEGDTVKTENEDGQTIALWDCSEVSESSRCVENAIRKGEWTIITATCK